MKSSTHLTRLVRALAVAAIVAGAAVPAALAANNPRDGRPPDIANAAALASSATAPDVIDRYVAAHPYSAALGLPRSATAIQTAKGDGFDWSDYGVGIGTGIGLVLLLAGGLAGARQRRHRVQAV